MTYTYYHEYAMHQVNSIFNSFILFVGGGAVDDENPSPRGSWGGSGELRRGGSGGGEETATGFGEAAFAGLGVDFAEHGAVDRGGGRLAAGGPHPLGEHFVDDGFAGHRFAAGLEDFVGGVETAGLFGFGFADVLFGFARLRRRGDFDFSGYRIGIGGGGGGVRGLFQDGRLGDLDFAGLGAFPGFGGLGAGLAGLRCTGLCCGGLGLGGFLGVLVLRHGEISFGLVAAGQAVPRSMGAVTRGEEAGQHTPASPPRRGPYAGPRESFLKLLHLYEILKYLKVGSDASVAAALYFFSDLEILLVSDGGGEFPNLPSLLSAFGVADNAVDSNLGAFAPSFDGYVSGFSFEFDSCGSHVILLFNYDMYIISCV